MYLDRHGQAAAEDYYSIYRAILFYERNYPPCYLVSRKQLASPHTILPAEKVRPSFYAHDATIISAKRRKQQEENDKVDGKVLFSGELSAVLQEPDLENREFQWYVLQDLDEGASFELRISYPATVRQYRKTSQNKWIFEKEKGKTLVLWGDSMISLN